MNNIKLKQFVQELIEHQTWVCIYLANGIQLQGVITEFDDCCLYLDHAIGEQLIMFSAISTILPKR